MDSEKVSLIKSKSSSSSSPPPVRPWETSFVYALVARRQGGRGGEGVHTMGPVVSLAEFSTRKGNLQKLALNCISQLDPSVESVTTFTVDDSKLSCTCRDGVIYGVLTHKNTKRQIINGVIGRLQDRVNLFDWEAIINAENMTLQGSLGEDIMEVVEHANSYPEEYDKLSVLQENTNALKQQLCKNVDAVLQRSESLQIVTHKADTMSSHSKKFTKVSSERKQELWWQNVKMKVVFCILALIVVLVVLMFILDVLEVLPWKIPGSAVHEDQDVPSNEEEAEDLYMQYLSSHNGGDGGN